MNRIISLLIICMIKASYSHGQIDMVTFQKSSIDVSSGNIVKGDYLIQSVSINHDYLENRSDSNTFIESGNALYYRQDEKFYLLDSVNRMNGGKYPVNLAVAREDLSNEDSLQKLFKKHKIKSAISTSKLICDTENRYWISTVGSGVYLIQNSEVANYKKRDGLISNFINEICEDKHGNIWLASYHGLSQITKNGINTFKSTTNGNKLKDIVKLIRPGNEDIVFITKNGMIGTIHNDSIVCDQFLDQNFFSYKIDEYGNNWVFFRTNDFDLYTYAYSPVLFDKFGHQYTYKKTFNEWEIKNWNTYIDQSNKLWILTHENIGYINENSDSINMFDYKGSYIGKVIENEGRIWFLSNFGSAWYNINNDTLKDLNITYNSTLNNKFNLISRKYYRIKYSKSNFVEGSVDNKILCQYSIIEKNSEVGIKTKIRIAETFESSVILFITESEVTNITEKFDDRDTRVIGAYYDSDGNYWLDTPTQIHKLSFKLN
jgi:ligand-binding sensor domain-containing protein